MSNKKIVFCGCGPMGEGILGGLLNNNVAKAKDVTVNELMEVRRTYIAETYGVAAVENASDALKAADLVIIAVNPAQVPKVAQTIRPLIKKILRVMPNTLIKSGNGYSAACVTPNIDEEDKKLITAVLNALGQTMYVTEDMFETFTAFCCTGPIWLYKTVEALVDAGVYAGFSRMESRNMVIKNMLGVAQVLDNTGAYPAKQVDDMTSPGGVTIEALQVLQQKGFAGTLMSSVDAAVKKANSIH